MTLLKLLRWPNLLIVGLTMYFLKYAGLYPAYSAFQIPFDLSEGQFLLFAFDMMLVTGGGYIINDIYDYPIDVLNKPDKVFVGRLISVKAAYSLYALLFVLGFGISAWLAHALSYWQWLFLFPLSWGMLWLYSAWLKKTPLWGNLTVGVFCGGVTLLVWLAEQRSYLQLCQKDAEAGRALQTILLFYALFALLSTLFREVVKDIEDMEGDRRYGCRTLPIVYGEMAGKRIALLFGVAMLLSVGCWLFFFRSYVNLWAWGYGLILVAVPCLYACYQTAKATESMQYHAASRTIKYMMLAGLLYLPVITWL